MIVGPELAAWLADRPAREATWARVGAFARRWAGTTPLPALGRAFDALERPDVDAVAALIRPLLEDTRWLDALLAAMIAEVARDPLFEPPLVPISGAVQTGLSLHVDRHVALSVGVGALDRLAAKRLAARPGSIVFPGHASLIRVMRGGGATLSLWQGGWRDGAIRPACEPAGHRRLRDGEVIAIDGRTTSFLVDHAGADIVLLHATLFADAAPSTCEYDGATRRLSATGAATMRASRVQLLTSLLGAMERPDASAFQAASAAPEPFARWHAMREWLARDADAALPRLAGIARTDPDPELRALAAQTLALVERTPCLA